MTPEQKLWNAVIDIKVSDAIFPFEIPVKLTTKEKPKSTIRKQYLFFKKLKESGKKLPKITPEREYYMRRGIYFLESDQFDVIIENIGYDSEYVRRTFNLVQEAITYRNKLYK